MKNLKKVLALVVVFSMMLCSVAFAAFPDVDEDASYANAVNTLAALGIIGGDDQGNFNPDNTITRAEATKIICEMQGLKGDANKGATIFTDVAADHWASGYINMATNMGIVNGMGDGTFAPEAPVTYEQIVKMIVVALGYEPMAADRGGYPTGYLVVAQSAGVTKNVTVPAQTDAAKRSLVAELVYNALDVPMMEKVGYGVNESWEVMDGTNDKARTTLLTTKFDVVKLGGVVIANEKIAINIVLGDTTCNGNSVEDEITLAYDNNYKSTNEDFELADRNDAEEINANVGETDAADLFGQRVIAFIQDTGREYVVLAIVPEDGKNDKVEVVFSDIDDIDATADEFKYFESDTAKKATKLDIADEIPVVWNSVAGFDTDYILDNLDTAARATLIDWDADNVYDLILVEEYAHYVVEEIDADIYTIETIDGESLELDMEDDDIAITIEDVDGNEVAFEEIAEGDVLAVISDNIYEPTFIDVTVLGQTGVEGVVKAVDTNSTPTKVTIEGTQYEVDPNAYRKEKASAIGSEGVFYIGIGGQIVAFDGTKATAGNYAIILDAAENSTGFDDGYQVKVLNKNGEAIIYNVADKLKIKNTEGTAISYDSDATDLDIDLADTAWEAYDGATSVAELLENFEGEPTTAAEIIERVVQIKVNSSNEITEIAPADKTGDDLFVNEGRDTEAVYKVSTSRLGDVGKVDSSSLIFSINNNDITKSKVVTADTLINEAEYDVVGFDKENSVLTAVVILSGGNTLAGSVEGWSVVTGISETRDANDNDAWSISFVENNNSEVKTILINEDTEVDGTYNTGDAMDLAENMGIGSLFLYSADADGNATIIASIANIVDDEYVVALKNGVDATYGTGSNAETYMYGATTDSVTNDLETTDGRIDIVSSSNKYRYNNANSRNIRIEVGTYKGGDVVTAKNGKGNLVFARLVDNDVVDIISINTRVDIADYEEEPEEEEPEVVYDFTATYYAEAVSATEALGAAADDKTVVVVFDEALAAGDYWFTIDNGETTYGIKMTSDGTLTKAGMSFIVEAMFEAWPDAVVGIAADDWTVNLYDYVDDSNASYTADALATGTFTVAE